MHKIKEKLMDELYEVEEKVKKAGDGKVSAGDLEYIHKLTDTIKNIDKIKMLEEDGGHSEAGDWMGEGRMYGTSYARGRGRNAPRDSMGRYTSYRGRSYNDGDSYRRGSYRGGSYDDGYSMNDGIDYMIDRAEELMGTAENSQQKEAIQRFIKELERMS